MVKIFTSPNCKYCIKAKAFFNKIGREFEEVDATQDPITLQALVDKTGIMAFPIVQIGEQYIAGYNPNQYIDAL